MNQRIHYSSPNFYSNKVLIGHWVEDRAQSLYVQEHHNHSTTYSEFFGPKPNSRIDPAVVWDQKLNSEESNFISQIGRNDYPNYFENFSSTYDLSYNHFPKCFQSYIPRTLRFRLGKYEPNEDYIPSFGNITNYGLLNYKKEQWACEKQEDPRLKYSTNYRETFSAPEIDHYKFKRWGIPLANSSTMDANNVQSMALKLRGEVLSNVPDAVKLVEVPREKRCNPITWECPENTNKHLQKCCI